MIRLLIVTLVSLLVFVGCRPQVPEVSADDLNIDVVFEPDPPVMGESAVTVTVTDQDGNAITDATINVRGDMSHAGMVPVIRDIETGDDSGAYESDYEWTMAGDWTVEVSVTLPNGESAVKQFTYAVAGDQDMEDMGDGEMEGMDHSAQDSTPTSAAYMRITNNGDEDLTLTGVTATFAGMSQIHETVVVDDVASMQQAENGVVIAAGETVTLEPGGYHVMLMQLASDLVADETVSLTLVFDNADSIELTVPVQDSPSDDSESITVDDLTIDSYWVRPAVVSSGE